MPQQKTLLVLLLLQYLTHSTNSILELLGFNITYRTNKLQNYIITAARRNEVVLESVVEIKNTSEKKRATYYISYYSSYLGFIILASN